MYILDSDLIWKNWVSLLVLLVYKFIETASNAVVKEVGKEYKTHTPSPRHHAFIKTSIQSKLVFQTLT